MGNLIMPKQTASLDRFYYSLKIFYNAYINNNPYVTNDEYKIEMTKHFDIFKTKNDGPKIVKQSEMARYFGLAKHSYNSNSTVITERGIQFYNAYLDNSQEEQIDLIIDSILYDSFGRNNTAIKTSDSDIDPPKLFIRSIIDLKGISAQEIALLIYYTHDLQLDYQDACTELKKFRTSSEDISVEIDETKRNKYLDNKFSTFLKNIGVCNKNSENKFILSDYVNKNYFSLLENLSIYNKEPATIKYTPNELFIDTSIEKDTDLNENYRNQVSRTLPYDIKSKVFYEQNNRNPIPNNRLQKNNRYSTDPRIAKTALALSNYTCEYDPTHKTFTGKNNNPFMEAHHLIPMIAQKDFNNINLDCIQNIISLCPNCHRAIHYGNDIERKEILNILFNERQEKLEDAGINIDFNTLFHKYYK